MSESKHTPGPWHFVQKNAGLMPDHGYGILYGEPDVFGWEKNLYVSVGCSTNAVRALGEGAPEANARLIAAAPDLLDSIDPDTLDAIANEIDCFKHSARAGSLRYVAKRQRAAIAKATGAAP